MSHRDALGAADARRRGSRRRAVLPRERDQDRGAVSARGADRHHGPPARRAPARAVRQNVIVESRAGASGAIGTAYVAQQPGNGCTILLSYDTHAVNPAVYPLTFDTVTAFKPVMLIGTIPNAVAVHASQPWQTFDQLMAAAKSGRLVYASGASAGITHFSMKLIEQLYGVEMQHVPYKGGAPAVQDLFGGHVPIMIGSVFAPAPGVIR